MAGLAAIRVDHGTQNGTHRNHALKKKRILSQGAAPLSLGFAAWDSDENA